jgi:choline kinase
LRALILAAGAGTRLRHLTEGRPKCLVPVGGRPLLDHQLEALRAVGVEDVVLVVGFEADQVRRHVQVGQTGGDATWVVNEEWDRTNSIYSFYLAARYLGDDDLLLFNCDILFDARLLRRLTEPAGSLIAVDSQAPRLAGEMNVRHEGGVVTAIGKHLDPAATDAVSVQLARFDVAGSGRVREELERLVRDDVRDAFPTSAYGPLIEAGGLRTVEAGDLPWAEIDTVEEHEQAEAEVAPRLLTSSSADS